MAREQISDAEYLELLKKYEYMNGFRGYMDTTKAMLVNSLFLYYLLDNELIEVQNDSTRSIICLEFTYGTKDYDESVSKRNSESKFSADHRERWCRLFNNQRCIIPCRRDGKQL